MKLNYKEAYDKVIDAYFKDEIRPMSAKFCFCGTLSPDDGWRYSFPFADYPYTLAEYGAMEKALFSGFPDLNRIAIGSVDVFPENELKSWEYSKLYCVGSRDEALKQLIPDYEDQLFNGMSAALEVLKDIHRKRGEDVDEEVNPFVKRKLEKAC